MFVSTQRLVARALEQVIDGADFKDSLLVHLLIAAKQIALSDEKG